MVVIRVLGGRVRAAHVSVSSLEQSSDRDGQIPVAWAMADSMVSGDQPLPAFHRW